MNDKLHRPHKGQSRFFDAGAEYGRRRHVTPEQREDLIQTLVDDHTIQASKTNPSRSRAFAVFAVAAIVGAAFMYAVIRTAATMLSGPPAFTSAPAQTPPITRYERNGRSAAIIETEKLPTAGAVDTETGLSLEEHRWIPTTFSVYGTVYDGDQTRSGEPYNHTLDTEPLSCASNDLPIGTWIVARYKLAEYKELDFYVTAVCRVNDTMHPRFTGKRVDLSGGAFHRLYPEYDYTDQTGTLLKGDYAVVTEQQAKDLIFAHQHHD